MSSLVLSDKQKKINRLKKNNIWSSVLPYVAGTMPFVHPLLGLSAGIGGGIYCASNLEKILKLHRDDFDSRYDKSMIIPDASIWTSTYLGQVYPLDQWKEQVDIRRRSKGRFTPNDRRDLASEIYPEMKPFALSEELFTRHMCVHSPTGSGKTELYMSIIYQQIKKGGGGIIVEGKSDSSFAGTVYQLMKECNRLDDLLIISTEHEDISHTWNPLIHGGPREQISMLMSSKEDSTDEFWKNIERYALSASILTLQLQPGNPAFNLKDLLALISDFNLMRQCVEKIRASDSDTHRSGKGFLISYLRHWYNENNEDFDLQRYKNLMSGTVSSLSAFSHSAYDKILNSYSPDVDLKDVILNGKVVILSMSALADSDGTSLLGRLFLADLARAVGELQKEKKRPLVMCPVLCDEYGSFVHEKQLNLFQLARSAWVPILIAMQGKGFIESKKNLAFAENVMGQCWHHIYGDVRDQKTREFAIAMAGTILNKLKQDSEGESYGESMGSESSGLLTKDNEGRSSSTGSRESRETMLQVEDFADLDEGDAFMIGKSGSYRIRLPLVKLSQKPAHWDEMTLTRHPKNSRPGIHLWEKFTAESSAILGIRH